MVTCTETDLQVLIFCISEFRIMRGELFVLKVFSPEVGFVMLQGISSREHVDLRNIYVYVEG